MDAFRSKELLFSYLGKLKSQGLQVVGYFKEIVELILNGTFHEQRYDIPHLQLIANTHPQLVENWKKGESGLTISDLLQEPVAKVAEIAIPKRVMEEKILKDGHLKIESTTPLAQYLNGKGDVHPYIQDLQDQLHRKDESIKIQYFCLQLMDAKLTESQKEKCLHELAKLCGNTPFKHDIEAWQKAMGPVFVQSDYRVSDTDDPNHLFLLGEEVLGSCQHITAGNPGHNKGLLGYMLNGYNRAVVVTEKNGKIVARALIRLYWDGKKPVLYQERLYTRGNDPQLKALVDAMCKRRAKSLQVTLVGAEGTGRAYPKPLEITGGRVDFEYVDAIGGIQASKHVVPECYVVQDFL